jgi:hypothetical protein
MLRTIPECHLLICHLAHTLKLFETHVLIQNVLSAILSFQHGVKEIFALLGCYAVQIGSSNFVIYFAQFLFSRERSWLMRSICYSNCCFGKEKLFISNANKYIKFFTVLTFCLRQPALCDKHKQQSSSLSNFLHSLVTWPYKVKYTLMHSILTHIISSFFSLRN